MTDEKYLTVRQAAERMQVSEETVRRWLRDGKMHGNLLSYRSGWRITETEVIRLLKGERE